MNPSRLFILRPVATALLMVAILLAGIVAYRELALSALPEVDYPTIQVVTLYPGASPDVVTSSITAPLERQFGQMPGLKQMSSTSSGGASVITLQFVLTVELDAAEQEVQAAINAGGNLLPSDLPSPPIYSKVNPADAPILTLGITSKTMKMPQVQNLVDTRLAQKISQVSGVGLVTLSGGQRPAVRVQVNPRAAASAGLSMEDLRAAVVAANVNQAKGSFDGPARAYTIDANDQLRSAAEYGSIIVAYKNGAPIYLSDIADIVEDAENARLAAWMNDTPAIIVNVQKQPGANVIEVVDAVKKLLPQLTAALPASIETQLLTDRTVTIRASVHDTQRELLLAIFLVVAVIFVFLRSATATLIPAAAVPLSIVGTFGVMYLAGFSINNLTLMALTIATGFVVDDAIVVIENIARYVEEGKSRMEAALLGSQQIAFTIISLTFSLVAVLIPLLFMGDVVGRLFREFAITLAVAILISAVVSLTLTPMMSARLLKHTPPEKQGRFFRKTGDYFDHLIRKYGDGLRWVLDHQPLTMIVFLVTLALTALLYLVIPKGFFPLQDTGLIQGISEAPQAVSFNSMGERSRALAQIILEDPAVESVSSFIGVDGQNITLNAGRLLIALKPHGTRDKAPVVMARLRDRLAHFEGMHLYMQPVQDLTIEDRVSRTQYQFTLESANADELAAWTNRFVEKLRTLPQMADVASDLQDQGLQAYVTIDRDTAGRLGVTPAGVDNALYNAFGQRMISTIFTQSTQYRVVLEVKPEFRLGPSALNDIYVPGAGGVQVPLSQVATISERPGALSINHLGQFPATTISFNLAGGKSLGQAVDAIEQAEKELNLPASVRVNFQGAALAFRASLLNTLLLILAAVVTMYIVLGVLYESYIHPLTILSTLPSAGVGALLSLLIAGQDLGIIAIIGIILLIGIVKKNAILMVDFALEAEREQGLPAREAIYQAALLRFRPILMTTMAALLGALPLMLSWGVGSELRRPLGIAMVGGLIFSQLLTIFTTPVIYLYFDRSAQRVREWRTRREAREVGAGDESVNITQPFVKRPVATTLLTIGVALAGGVSFGLLPVSPLPQVDFPVVSVSASLPGASPEVMAATVATPLERALGRIAGVNEMTSSSSLGSTRVTLQFELNRDINGAAREVQAAIQAARSSLPTSLPNNPTYRKANPADAPIMILAMTSERFNRGQMYDMASTILAQRISQVPGVGQVTVGGGSLPAVRVEINPTILNKLSIGFDEVRTAITSTNANRPKGFLDDGVSYWQVQANDQAKSAAEYLPIIIAYRNGAAVRLADVARVEDSVQDLRNHGMANGKPAVLLIINRQPNANILETVDRVVDMLPELRASIPQEVNLEKTMERTTTIRASLHEVERTLIISVALVILVVFLFLRNARATLIPAIAVPISLIGTFAAMYLLGYSLNNLSLMALTIATGFVVDDAIVVLENVTRYIEKGMAPMEAALVGAREVAFTVVSMSVSLVAVFIPILFMGGIVGRLFREFAVTLSVAIGISLVVSLTTTPMMCSRLLKRVEPGKQGRLSRWSEKVFDGMVRGYGRSLGWALRWPFVMLLIFIATVVLNVYLYTVVPKGFFPQQDTGLMIGFARADQSISFQAMKTKLENLMAIVMQDPAVANVTGFTGSGGFGSRNSAQMFVTLKPLKERDPVDVIQARLRTQLSKEPGVNLFLNPIQDLRGGGRQSDAAQQFTLRGEDVNELRTWATRLENALRDVPELTDVSSDQQNRGLQMTLVVDRASASRMGVSMRAIDSALNLAFGQSQVSTIYQDRNQYRVVMEAAPEYWQSPETLSQIVVLSNTRAQVPLSALARYEPTLAPLSVSHQGAFAAATISFNLAPGVAMSEASDLIRDTLARIGAPTNIYASFEGSSKLFQQGLDKQPWLILAALLTVYIVLGILYESTVHPITILSTLPSAGVGALLALLLFKTEFTLIALIGVILLIGIVKKNAILMIDFALQVEREQHLAPRDAIYQASLLRFRPIMMTTMAAALGAIPLALGTGDGAEMRRPLGISIVGGLLVSQLLTLYTTPVIYLYLDNMRLRAKRLFRRGEPVPRAAHAGD